MWLSRSIQYFLALIGVLLLSPIFVLIAIWILLDSNGSFIYKQKRIGLNGKEFNIYKFRTMYVNSDKKGLLTTSDQDSRITQAGKTLRKYKLDELPQLFNVLNGTMNLVGPRPEVSKYVELYNSIQRKVLEEKPGITDYASLEFSNENEILAKYEDPEKAYMEILMPQKLELNLKYIQEKSFLIDIQIIFKTIMKILS